MLAPSRPALPCVAVVDVDGTTRKAEAAGASLAVPPRDVPGVGRFAMRRDPQGAHRSIRRFDA